MMELDVDSRRAAPPADSSAKANYLILGDFGGSPGKPMPVDRDKLPNALELLKVTLGGERVRQMDDFHPDKLYQRLSVFSDLRGELPQPAAPPRAVPSANLEEILSQSSLLEQMTGGDPLKKYAKELGQAYAEPATAASPEQTAALGDRMRGVLHDPGFQALEAAWRGVEFAAQRIDDESARLYIAQCSAADLAELLAADDLTATRVCTLLHSNQWSAVIGLFSFGAADIELLGRIALLAASAGAPFIAEGSADMGEDWEELRSIPEAGFVGLALPRFLLRLPYGSGTSPIESFEFEEMPGAPVESAYLWGNPALACLALAAGPERGRDLDIHDLPSHIYHEDGEWKKISCAEALMNETRIYALMGLGLMPIVSYRDTDRVRLAGLRAINGKPLPLAVE